MKKKLIILVLSFVFLINISFAQAESFLVSSLKTISSSIIMIEGGSALVLTGIFLMGEVKNLIFSNKEKNFDFEKEVIKKSNELLKDNKEVFWIETDVFNQKN